MEIINARTGRSLGDRIAKANTFWRRLRGLLGRRSLAPGEGLLLEPCQAVHGLGMAFVCDIVYLDTDNRVVYQGQLRRNGRGPYRRDARRVLEVPEGVLDESETKVGDVLQIR